jgi:hypothetical protein
VRSTLKPEIRMADKLARDFVLERDGNRCVCCAKRGQNDYGTGLDWAHVLSRSSRYLRWDPDNVILLCGGLDGCHGMFTRAPKRFRAFIDQRYPGRWDELTRRRAEAERRGDHVDVQAVIAFYRERLTPAESARYWGGEW